MFRASDIFRRQLDRPERREYLDAVICLTRRPAVSGINGTVNRYDDFQAVHSIQTPHIHWVVGICSLPWLFRFC